jgi:hypothetical protein
VPDYQSLFEQERFMWFDEQVLSSFLKETSHSFQIKWDTILCNQERGIDSWQGYYLDKWLWINGKLFKLDNKNQRHEVMYLHFISWKRKMIKSKVKYKINDYFFISYNAIQPKRHSFIKLKLNAIKNKIFGFWFRERMKVILKKYKKRIKIKINKI